MDHTSFSNEREDRDCILYSVLKRREILTAKKVQVRETNCVGNLKLVSEIELHHSMREEVF